MKQIVILSEDVKKYTSRVRFILKDLIDMYKNGWQARIVVEQATKIGSTSNTTTSAGAISTKDDNKSMSTKQQQQQSYSTNTGGGGSSPRTQDARQQSSFSSKPNTPSHASATTNNTAIPASGSTDEWTTVGPTKTSKPAPFDKATSMDNLQRGGGGGQGSGGGGGGQGKLDSKKKSTSSRDLTATNTNANNNNSNNNNKQSSGNLNKLGSSSKHPSSNKLNTTNNTPNTNNNNRNRSNNNGSPEPTTSTNANNNTTSNNTVSFEHTTALPITTSTEEEGNIEIDYTTPISKDILNSIRVTLDEYIINNIDNDVIIDLTEKFTLYPILIHRMSDILKYLIINILERKGDNDRMQFNPFLLLLYNNKIINKDDIIRSIYLLLNELDELTLDIPKISSYFSYIIAYLVYNNIITLSFLCNIPEENNYNMSMNAFDFLAEILQVIQSTHAAATTTTTTDTTTNTNSFNTDTTTTTTHTNTNTSTITAEVAYQQGGGVTLLRSLPLNPNETIEESVIRIVDTYNLPFIKL